MNNRRYLLLGNWENLYVFCKIAAAALALFNYCLEFRVAEKLSKVACSIIWAGIQCLKAFGLDKLAVSNQKTLVYEIRL